jgi:hypothetical protein
LPAWPNKFTAIVRAFKMKMEMKRTLENQREKIEIRKKHLERQ